MPSRQFEKWVDDKLRDMRLASRRMTDSAVRATVWDVSWTEYYGSGDGDFSERHVLFDSKEAAEASCPTDGKVTEVEIRSAPSPTRTCYRVYVSYEDGMPSIGAVEPYTVVDGQSHYGLGIEHESGWRLDGDQYHGPDEAALLEYVHSKYDGEIERKTKAEAARLAYLARCTHEFVCPDHGSLGMGTPESSRGCSKCHRMVDVNGHRFGAYRFTPTELSASDFGVGVRFTSTVVFNGPQLARDGDEGPMSEAEWKKERGG